MAELKDIAKLNGMTMKTLAIESGINYTTLMALAKRPMESWGDDNTRKLSGALQVTQVDLENAMKKKLVAPFIKWVGGKRQLLPSLKHHLPKEGYNSYYEPFVGGGALLLSLTPEKAVINDANSELTNTWEMVKNNLPELIELLHKHEDADSKEHYLDVRGVDRTGEILEMSNVERAARFIYMNKAGYNGLWRVNSRGQNNVPYGDHKKLNLVSESLIAVSDYLNRAEITITNQDYKDAANRANPGDLVYFDPPYVPLTPTSTFTSYTQNGFGLVQQEELRDLAIDLAKRGVKVMLSNSETTIVSELYKDDVFNVHHVQANRYINSKASGRGKVGEVIITTY